MKIETTVRVTLSAEEVEEAVRYWLKLAKDMDVKKDEDIEFLIQRDNEGVKQLAGAEFEIENE